MRALGSLIQCFDSMASSGFAGGGRQGLSFAIQSQRELQELCQQVFVPMLPSSSLRFQAFRAILGSCCSNSCDGPVRKTSGIDPTTTQSTFGFVSTSRKVLTFILGSLCDCHFPRKNWALIEPLEEADQAAQGLFTISLNSYKFSLNFFNARYPWCFTVSLRGFQRQSH